MKAQGPTRRIASLDLGTNTILLLIADLQEAGSFVVLDDRAEITRLGEGVDHAGFLSETAQRRTLAVLRDFAERCRILGVDEVVVVGTSALRDAANRDEFKQRLQHECGWQLRVLSGEEEARYSFSAVCGGLDLKGRDVLAVDVGGGSTELIWGKDGAVAGWTSMQLGSVRLTERYLVSDPATEEECCRVIFAVDQEITRQCAALPVIKAQTAVGIAGTFTTLAAITKGLEIYSHREVHGSRLTRADVERLNGFFKGKTAAERNRIPGLDPGRADVILAGALLIDRVMAFFEIGEVVVSDQGVRYGLLYEKLSEKDQKPGPASP
jgi:exopolyphosphatase / guanosine-5'-triphosphate,3'-diphosphate pyrophosphatase